MKKCYLLLGQVLLCCSLIAQDNITYTKMVDSLLLPVSKTQITTGILYDRVAPFASLHSFKNTDTSFYSYFKQAYSELYNAAYNNAAMTKEAKIDTLSTAFYYSSNVVAVGVLYYDFNLIDTLAISNNLFYRGSDSLLHDVVGRTGNPFKLKNITIAAALARDTLQYGSGSITFKYTNQLFLTNKGVSITSILADFGSGNQNLTSGSNVTATFASPGAKTIKFTITYSNSQVATVYSKLYLTTIPFSPRFGAPITPDETKDFFDTEYGYQGYGETAKKYNWGQYGVYYHRTSPGGPKENVLRKPIIILDGFDPTEQRNISDLYGIYLQYTSTQNFGNEMLDKGYDVIVLNFPKKQEGVVNTAGGSFPIYRVQGADLIQRNAFLLVTLIKKINLELAANGSTEKLVVIGPSMGGLISRYALRWMEQNGLNHNTRLWVSFDAPHKGANIPIGDQYFLDFYATKLKSQSALNARDNSLNSYAAQQMLLHHFSANSTTPTGAANFRNNWQTELDNLGYPQNLRKIALINGAINGTTQGTTCQNVYKLKVNIHAPNLFLFFVQIIKVTESSVWFTGSNGSACEVFKGWAKLPFLSNSKSAAAPASSKSYDIVPGGYYDAQAQLGGSNIKFGFLFGSPYKPSVIPSTGYFGMWTETNSDILNPNHCFIPTFSALGMTTANKDLSENLYNRDLVCTGETPFQSYYAPLTNQEHITLTIDNVAWIKKEIDGIPQMSSVNYAAMYPIVKTAGAEPLCTTATYQVNSLPAGSTIAWQSSNPTIATVPASGNPVTVTRQGVQNGTVTITATITRTCGGPVILTKTLSIGTPPATITSVTQPPPPSGTINVFFNLPAGGSPITSHKFYIDNVMVYSSSGIPNSPTILNGGSCGMHAVRLDIVTACGTGASNSFQYYKSCSMFAASPNPTTGAVTVEMTEDNGTPSSDPNETVSSRRSASGSASTRKIYKIMITDASGRKLKQFDYKNGIKKTVIDLFDLRAGVYNVNAFDGKNWQISKVLKQ